MNMQKLDFPLCTFVPFVIQAIELHQPQKTRRYTKETKTKKPQPEGEALQTACHGRPRNEKNLLHSDGLNHHVLTQLTPILEHDPARDLGKQRIVLAPANVQPRLHPRPPLPNDNRSAGNQLPAKSLKA
jgi:hypothetical protein